MITFSTLHMSSLGHREVQQGAQVSIADKWGSCSGRSLYRLYLSYMTVY